MEQDVLKRFMQEEESDEVMKDKLKELQDQIASENQLLDDHGDQIIGSRDYPLES